MKIKLVVLFLMVMGISGCASKTERQFVSGCESGGIEQSTCECIYDKLEDKYGENDLKNNLYTMSQTEHFQQDMVNSSMQCMRE